jgi:hypothetical protein
MVVGSKLAKKLNHDFKQKKCAFLQHQKKVFDEN